MPDKKTKEKTDNEEKDSIIKESAKIKTAGDVEIVQKDEQEETKNTEKETTPTVNVTAKGKKRKKKIIRQISHGRAYIQATYNNTIITLTDLNGNVLAWSSAGQNGFKGPKKATPYAASVIVKDAVEKSKVYGLKNVNVFIKGIGSGRESAVRSLNTYGLNVLSIKDITPIPHNGCRKRKPRRV